MKTQDYINTIISRPSPNYSERDGWIPDIICCHQTGINLKKKLWLYDNKESHLSANYGVARNGTIYQFVPIELSAHGNGTHYKEKGERKYSNHCLNALNGIVRKRMADANLYTVSVEFENCTSGILRPEQYAAGLELMKYIISFIKDYYGYDFEIDRAHIIGHYECSPVNNVNCPGIDFPFGKFIGDLNKAFE